MLNPVLSFLLMSILLASQPGEASKVAKMSLTSPAFKNGQPIPKVYSGEGKDISPPLVWSGLPATTKELALLCEDPDSPTSKPWVHWIVYHIPVSVRHLTEAVPQIKRNFPATYQGRPKESILGIS